MKTLKTIGAATAAGALLLTLGACGSSGDKINIGIKYDQPGLGLKDGSKYSGFDVRVATYVAKELGYKESNINFIETPSSQRETMIQGGQVKLIFATYSITDSRKQTVSFAGPYLQAGQSLLVRADNTDITGPESLKGGKKLCSVTGSTPAQNIKDKYANDVQLSQQDTYSKCVSALASGSVDAVTTDDVILAGYAAQAQYKGKLKVVGKPFTTEKYGVGLKKGDTETCTKVNAALKKMVDSGEWKKALDATIGESGYQVNADTNPPQQADCS